MVVGASGQVGSTLFGILDSQKLLRTAVRTSRDEVPGWLQLDLAKLATSSHALIPVERVDPDVIFCVGGMTFVDGCEVEPEACFRSNALGPGALAAYAQKHVVPFVFFSTDYVFSGTAELPGPYNEADVPRPLSVYGASKLAGEQAVLEACPSALVVRTTVVYGPEVAGKNFLYTLLRHLAGGRRTRVPQDQISTPTYNVDLAQITLALLEAGASGIVHVAGPEHMDRFQFALTVAAFFGLDERLIEGVSTASLGQAAKRPLVSGLATDKMQSLVPRVSRHTLEEALRDSEGELRAFLSALLH